MSEQLNTTWIASEEEFKQYLNFASQRPEYVFALLAFDAALDGVIAGNRPNANPEAEAFYVIRNELRLGDSPLGDAEGDWLQYRGRIHVGSSIR